jgi:VanZ family protein
LKRILILVTALILYGSVYPWHFQMTHLPANPLWILLHSWPDGADRFLYRDAAINLTLYVPFGVFCFLSISEARSLAFRSVATVLAAAILSSSIEMTQLFTPERVCSLFDVACNVTGAAIGIRLAVTFAGSIYQAVNETQAAGVFSLSGVIALLYLWTGYLLFPFFPALSQSALRPKLIALLSLGIAPRDFFESLGGWLAAAALLHSLAGRRRPGKMLAMALLLIPLKLLIADRTMSGSEAAGALAGVGFWMLFRGLRRPRLASGIVAILALAAAGLVPFEFSRTAQAFTWVPFLPMLQAPWETAFLTLLHKSFLYGSAVWLIHADRGGWLISSLIVAVPLAMLEALQVFLPGRTPELTDPLLAILMGSGLALLERGRPATRWGQPELTAGS